MQRVSVPWAIWYGDRFEFTFPDSWEVIEAHMRGGPDIGDEGIRQAFADPIGSPPLRELARGRRDAAILIDDLTRPTPAYRTVPYILQELAAAGLGDDQVRIVCALACHRAMTRDDFIKKLGLDLVERLHIVNHNAHDNLEFYGLTSQGVPLWVNRDFALADLKIAAGMITPRGPFFGGGCKLLLPGACGWQTIYADHSRITADIFRAHAAEVARMVGLEFIVNPMLNEKREIMAIVTGDPEEAYWHGVEIGKELYLTEVPEAADVVICNAWPKDSEGTQSAMALVPLHSAYGKVLKEGSTVVIATASPEGLGYHSLMGPGTQLRLKQLADQEGRLSWAGIVFSPNLHREDVRVMYGDAVRFCKTWPEVLAILESKYGSSARVCVFPTGAMQYTSV
jgi:nickel-dependent lactate racemase